jgi:hypothetical protein
MTVGSQATYKLRPYQSRTFIIDESEGFRVEFHLGTDGKWMNCSSISRMERSWLGERRLRRLAEAENVRISHITSIPRLMERAAIEG